MSRQVANLPHGRRGFTILELLVTFILLGVVMATMVPLLGRAAAERRAAERQQVVLLEAGNLMERIAARPWDELTPEWAAGLTLSEAAAGALDEPELDVSITDAAAVDEAGALPAARRITVAITWEDRAGRRVAPVRLTAWRHRTEGGQP